MLKEFEEAKKEDEERDKIGGDLGLGEVDVINKLGSTRIEEEDNNRDESSVGKRNNIGIERKGKKKRNSRREGGSEKGNYYS